jgi:hypothetical protein
MTAALRSVAGVLALGVVLYPVSLPGLREVVALVALASGLCFAVAVATRHRSFALGGAALWAVEYAVALLFSGRTDLRAPVAAVCCVLVLELLDLVGLQAEQVRQGLGDAAVAVVGGGLAALACTGAGVAVEGNSPWLVFLGAAAGIGAVSITVVLGRRSTEAG